MNETQPKCSCSTAPKLIFACSGASDVGEVTDRVARRLTKLGVGRMYCLAGLGGKVEDMIVNTRAAAKILAVDGCPKDCARLTLQNAGFGQFTHLRLSDMGLEKGKAAPTHDIMEPVVEKATQMLAG